MNYRFVSLLTFLILLISSVSGQFKSPQFSIQKSKDEIKVDGQLNEASWLSAELAGQFIQQFPFDSTRSITQTQVRATYDEHFLYFGVVCLNRDSNQKYVVQTLKRDFDDELNDGFHIVLDPFEDQYNGFSFQISPYNVQAEGLITSGGTYGQSNNWDNRWYSQVIRYADRWVAEIAIPFKTLRFSTDIRSWGVNFARVDLQHNEVSVWSPIPRTFSLTSLAFTGKMSWDAPPKKTGVNVSLIPYLIGEANRDYLNQSKAQTRFSGGGDAKVAISSSLNLDLTVNPDFSQADVDRQITNLTRFSLFFPERRQFFLENNDLFGQFGFSQIRPFFSRQIGLSNGNRIPIQYGVRLSGKLNKKWRIGLLNVQTGADSSLKVNPENFTVACFQRQVGARSNIGAIFVNRQETEGLTLNSLKFNRVAGLDYKLASKNGKWNGIAFFHKSFDPNGIKPEDYAHASFLRYDDANWSLMWNHEYVGKNYNAASGFVPRQSQYDGFNQKSVNLSFWRLEPQIQYRWFPKRSKINIVEHSIYWSAYTDSSLRFTESILNFNTQLNFTNSAYAGINYNYNYYRLIFPIDVTFSGASLLPAIGYINSDFSIYGRTDIRKKITGSAVLGWGQFYTGFKTSISATSQFRFPPFGLIGLNYTRDEINLGSNFKPTTLNLIGPQLDISFSRNMFFSSILQYNDQLKNMNIFARFQWRFQPMSDFFIVFTDNFQTPDLKKKNRAVVLKLVYWFTP